METYFKKDGFTTYYKLICKTCGKEFISKANNALYCSKDCKPKPKIKYVPKSPITKQCAFCGNTFQTITNNRKYCSDKCKGRSNYYTSDYEMIRRKQQQEDRRSSAPLIHCAFCGKEISSFHGRIFCSYNCCKSFHRNERKYTFHRDERLSQAVACDNAINLHTLIKRDKNICQICGNPCNLYDYEVTSTGIMICGDSYPSIDHIYPCSKGGSHTWANVQLACLKCNREKSDFVGRKEKAD